MCGPCRPGLVELVNLVRSKTGAPDQKLRALVLLLVVISGAWLGPSCLLTPKGGAGFSVDQKPGLWELEPSWDHLASLSGSKRGDPWWLGSFQLWKGGKAPLVVPASEFDDILTRKTDRKGLRGGAV